jgi:elongation factor Ts
MADVSAADIKKLRDITGAGMLDCKNALVEKKGNMDEAVKLLREKGIAKAESRGGKATGEGIVISYIHPGDRLGVLLELNCETDFASRTEEFRQLGKDLCMQVAASAPLYVAKENVPEEAKKREMEIYQEQAKQSGKPAAVIQKIAEGKLEKWYEEVCLLEQPFIKDQEKRVKELVAELSAKTGENIKVKRFVRYVLGE